MKVLAEAFPSETDRNLVLAQLAASMYEAEAVAQDAWAVTLFPNGFRLNVGRVEAMTAFAGQVRLLLHGMSESIRHQIAAMVEQAPYRSVSGENFIFCGNVQELSRHRDAILPLHYEFIHLAGTKRGGMPVSGTRHRESHSPGLVNLAESITASRQDGEVTWKNNPAASEAAIRRRKRLSKDEQISIFQRDGWLCCWCKKPVIFGPTMRLLEMDVRNAGHNAPLAYYHGHWTRHGAPLLDELGGVLDHVEAFVAGGPCDSDNLVTSCAKCNGRKSTAPLEKWNGRPKPSPIKGKYGEPQNWDGLTALFVVLAERNLANLTATEQDWLRAIKNHVG